MEYFFSLALHIFIMALILFFGIMCLIASGGRFDKWNSRLKKRGSRAAVDVRTQQPIIGMINKYIVVRYL